MISKSWVSVQEPCTCCVQLYGDAPGGSANHQPLLNHNTTQHNTPAHSHTVFSNYSMCYISLELCSQNKHHHCAQTPFMGTIQAFGLKRDTAELHRRNVVEMKWICGLFFVYTEKVSEMPFSAQLLVLWFLSSARCNITASDPLSRLYLCLLFQCQAFKTSK